MAIQYATAETFDSLVAQDFVIVDFFSDHCGPCKVFSKVLEDTAAELPFVNIVKVNTTAEPSLGERFEIHAVPTVHFYKDGKFVEGHLGVIPANKLREMIAGYLF